MSTNKLSSIREHNALVGTWKLKSYFVTSGAGGRTFPYGDNPMGHLTYSAEGRMQVIATASGRTAPSSVTPPNDARAALYDTMFAYAGTYSVEADTVIHHVDISWNEDWAGTNQTRRFNLIGGVLTLTMRINDPNTDAEVQYTAEWEKVVHITDPVARQRP